MSSHRIGSREPHLRPPSCRIQHRKLRHSDSIKDFPPEKTNGETLHPNLIACKSQGAKRKSRHTDNIEDFPSEERDGKKLSLSLIACKSQGANRASSLSKCVGIQLLDDDTLIEILSRLSLECILRVKCVCKQWLHLTNSNLFRNAHFQKSKNDLAGIFLQGMLYCLCCKDVVDYPSPEFVGIDKEGRSIVTRNNMLDFLPENAIVTSSSNGLIICRSFFKTSKDHIYHLPVENPPHAELVIYVCNPLTKEFRVLKPKLRNEDRCALGLAFTSTYFQVLVVQVVRKAKGSFCFTFKIFSSKTNTWKASNENCYHSHRLLLQRHAFANGVFYWLALGHSVLAFDLEKERGHIIKLPGPVLREESSYGCCIGVSEDKLHYVVSTLSEFMVWILSGDYLNPQWQLKHFRHIVGYDLVHPKDWDGAVTLKANAYNEPNYNLNPWVLIDDVVYMARDYFLTSYNIKTGDTVNLTFFTNLKTIPHTTPFVIPYSGSLLPVSQ